MLKNVFSFMFPASLRVPFICTLVSGNYDTVMLVRISITEHVSNRFGTISTNRHNYFTRWL
jgi:hypothetical protein